MLTRVAVALVGLPVLLYIIYDAPAWAIPTALSALSAMGVYEALWSTGFLKCSPRVVAYSILVSAAVPFWVYAGSPAHYAQLVLLIYVIALFAENIASGNTIGLGRLGGGFLLALFVPYFLSAFVHLRGMENWRFYVIFPFVTAFLSDIFALFGGMAFGKHKLAPKVSPKKTVEGLIGGVLSSVIILQLVGLIFTYGIYGGERQANWLSLFIIGFFGAFVSVLGDLSFSLIKRSCHIKDFGSVIPGHGGILDRFDSVIFTAPFVYMVTMLLPIVS